jgi:hypothetical protein
LKALTLALLLSLFVPKLAPPVRQPVGQLAHRTKGGRWYFAASGHAIYCYGPVMTVPGSDGNLQKVATICQDGSAVVPLKD